jgi:hypothetical protein
VLLSRGIIVVVFFGDLILVVVDSKGLLSFLLTFMRDIYVCI